MNQSVTVGMVVYPLIVIAGLVGVAGLCLFVLWIMNPFRSGH